ncbi:MAG TPA: NFACT RNA binding domain-containing protein, partial [Candidatus Cybelea sp.]
RAVQIGAPYAMPPLPAAPRTLAPAGDRDVETGEPLYVYRRDAKIVAAYPLPLEAGEGSTVTREDSLIDVFAQLRREQSARAENERGRRRREALIKRLAERDVRLQREVERLRSKRDAAERREEMRSQGEEIFATLHTLTPGEREPAKERAAELFAEYRKLANSLPHLAQRRRAIEESRGAIEMLRWEAERTAAEDFGDVEAAVDLLLRRREPPGRRAARKRKRQVLELRTATGSRIAIGRSPSENAELTFRVARPNDLWFHAKGVPGAHVILSRDDRTSVPEQDLETAASLAAFYSKAKEANAAPVDYTLRKHVRKQRAAPPGLVWYTNAKTIVAHPNSLETFKKDTLP